jgi:ABC-type phosphate/phosphonate transport system ATPase subunit
VELKGFTPKCLKVPAPVVTLTRNKDMYDVISLLKETSIVQIFGIPGVGKSTLARNLATYIGERNIYREGVCFINVNNVGSV